MTTKLCYAIATVLLDSSMLDKNADKMAKTLGCKLCLAKQCLSGPPEKREPFINVNFRPLYGRNPTKVIK